MTDEIQPKQVRAAIICLCGSTKFKDAFIKAAKEESLKGKIVLSVSFFSHADEVEVTEYEKRMLDHLHLKKIEMADEVLILNVGGYVGESTANEIKHAERLKKPIKFLE